MICKVDIVPFEYSFESLKIIEHKTLRVRSFTLIVEAIQAVKPHIKVEMNLKSN